MEGEERLTLTGQLGDVMKESAQIALSWVRGHADQLELEPGRPARLVPRARAAGASRRTARAPASR
jgi:ATP-dependent Lon protease